jgi:glycosyltransferase involved in cell wall biosynthesis
MRRETLLFLSPIMPDETGNGLAMRAGVALEALAQRFDVHLGLVPVAGTNEGTSPLVGRCAASVRSLPLSEHLEPHFGLIERIVDEDARRRSRLAYPKPFLCRFCTSRSAATVAEWCDSEGIRAVHVMRLYLAPLVEALSARNAPQRPLKVLDLDEDEVATRRSLAALHRRQGDAERAAEEEQEANKYARLLARVPGAFDRVLVSSPIEVQRIRSTVPDLPTVVLPNAAPRVAVSARRRAGGANRHRLLFVGNLSYAPNRDGVVFLCRDILPQLRASLPRPVELMIAGGGVSTEVATIAETAGASLLGYVGDLAPLYAEADVAVVPLRAGGGTRIKVLEAFAHRVPVVATSNGIEGIAATAGEHAMVADGSAEFAAACHALLTTPELADRTAARALELVQSVYLIERVEAMLLALYDQL